MNNLPLDILTAVERDLIELTAAPTELSRPSYFPYRPCQCYVVNHEDTEGRLFILTILFVYTQDERSLYVIAIARAIV